MNRHQYDRYTDSSTISKMQQQYWSTKQVVLKKLGKKDDECIVASDSELDSKLEMFAAVQESCTHLMRVLELYQDKLIVLAQEENSFGRFLKDCGKQDKTRAGKMMIATGKTLSFTAQKRLELRTPLVRLYQEVETFQVRAITDTFMTVDKMEKSRTAYRGNLMWMKDISQQLDPDMNRQVEKFRKVQGHVRKTKVKFDKLKIDTLQKVDLLVASRCNMFSHALVSYQNTLLQFWEKTSKTMTTVADSFKGYQHYEFNMLKELTETSKKLAEETNTSQIVLGDEEEDKDKLIFFDAEYHDEDPEPDRKVIRSERRRKSDSLQNLYNSPAKGSSSSISKKNIPPPPDDCDNGQQDSILLNFNDATSTTTPLNGGIETKTTELQWQKDLLTGNPELDDCDKDDLLLLNEILNSSTMPSDSGFAHEWTSAFGTTCSAGDPNDISSFVGYTSLFNTAASGPVTTEQTENAGPESANRVEEDNNGFMPSQLLQHSNGASSSSTKMTSDKQRSPKPMSALSLAKKNKKDMSAWFNLFADLDPLGNPDALDSKSNLAEEDRSC